MSDARQRTGLSPKAFGASVFLPIICGIVVLAVLVVAPGVERVPILGATLVAIASGLAATSIGVYGGVLVPGLLLLGVDARFAAAISLFLQVLVIPLGAASHYRLGNVTRTIAIPLIVGGMIGAAIGPLFAAALPKDLIARIVAGMIILVGFVVLATLRWGGLGSVRAEGDVPRARVGLIGAVAGFSSGISGAGWGPIGVKLLILTRIDPRQAIGSSLMGRIFMAATAVTVYVVSASAFTDVTPNWWLVIPLLAGSVAAMVPGAYLLSRLGRESATIGITLLSIVLALPTLIWG
ncbi:MAG: sulfite exporter TauE/SafE family protein [Chloroflexi bacterium]|nr:sulfite exporter TauE/SafE family protein [Chloroflexota bacterium]MBA3626260.1 sulfite exporter TauE/SafE family protein [Chloroflexota bacterium]MBA3795937.1 sulfite exporter TauE/SafE family protein [Chloroflexota bacterium]